MNRLEFGFRPFDRIVHGLHLFLFTGFTTSDSHTKKLDVTVKDLWGPQHEMNHLSSSLQFKAESCNMITNTT